MAMNEQTPRDPQPPYDPAGDGPADHGRTDHVGANDPLPRDPAAGDPARADAPDDATTRVHEPVPAAAAQRSRGILKPVLIGSAAALTVLAVAGVGMTIADAVDDDGGDPSSSSSSAPLASAPAPTAPGATDDPGATDGPGANRAPGASVEPGDDRGGDRDGRGHDDDGRGEGPGSGHASGAGAASSEAPDLVAAIETAIAAAGGGSATSIEVEGGGWHVDVRLDDGSELDVRVPVSGDALVREDDHDDRSSDLALDTARIPAIVDAAVAAAGGGSVRSIESEDDEVRYEVEVAIDGDDTDIDLADDLTVLAVER